jgi:hypothetical protein
MKFPRKGPIAGVRMLWEQPQGDLSKHGTVSHDPSDGKTGANGIATLVFKPKDEKGMGIGMSRSERGVVNGIALYQTAFGLKIPGGVAQFLVPKYAGSAYEVEWHEESLELNMRARTTYDDGTGEIITTDVQVSRMPFARSGSDTFNGTKGLQLLSYHKSDIECWTHSWNASPGDPFVGNLRLNRSGPGIGVGGMTINPGTLNENITHNYTCDPQSTYTDQQHGYAEPMKNAFPDGVVQGPWEQGSGEVFARKTVNVSGGSWSANVTFELIRVPAPN